MITASLPKLLESKLLLFLNTPGLERLKLDKKSLKRGCMNQQASGRAPRAPGPSWPQRDGRIRKDRLDEEH
jgi:hypothetical protein